MSVADKTKRCPSCLVLTPPDKQVKRVSRSSGKTTVQMRCIACDTKTKLRQKAK
jgi:RNase P subunit RPR2